jgi:hypothetical protein
LKGVGLLVKPTKSTQGAEGAALLSASVAGWPAICVPEPVSTGIPVMPARPGPAETQVAKFATVKVTASLAIPLATTSSE